MAQLLVGFALLLAGALAIILPISALSQTVYPILWWGLILVLDQVNFRIHKSSPIKENKIFFWGVLVPLSTIYWLYFELANIYFPQWQYLGTPTSILLNTAMTFASFATVIPAIVEIFWLIHPKNENHNKILPQYAPIFIVAGILSITVPFWSDNFILNQLIWIGPFLIVLPFIKILPLNPKFILAGTAAGLLSGFLWESLNFWAGGKWEYLILPEIFRIFEMPIVGYLGFIPFAFSTLGIYWIIKDVLKPKFLIIVIVCILATVFSYFFARFIS